MSSIKKRRRTVEQVKKKRGRPIGLKEGLGIVIVLAALVSLNVVWVAMWQRTHSAEAPETTREMLMSQGYFTFVILLMDGVFLGYGLFSLIRWWRHRGP